MNIHEVKLNLLRRCNFSSQLVDKSSSGTATQLADELRAAFDKASSGAPTLPPSDFSALLGALDEPEPGAPHLTAWLNDFVGADGLLRRDDFVNTAGPKRYRPICPSLEVALENLENALKERARDPDPSKPPVVWAPPNLRAPSDEETAGVSELKFVKMNLKESAKTHPPDGELLEAIVTFESFWEMNSKMFKAMVLQRKMVNFLAACARTDGSRFSKMLLERTRDSPAEVLATMSDPERAAALDAVNKNNKKRGKKNDKKGEEQDDAEVALMAAKARLEHNVEVRVSAGGKKG